MQTDGDLGRRERELPLHEVCIEGRITAPLTDWIENVTVRAEPGGITTLICPGLDQSALHGLLARLRDLGLPIISIRRLPLEETCSIGATTCRS